jgi:hypothetical protein
MLIRLFYLALVVLLAPLFFAFAYEGALFLASVFSLDATKGFLIGAAVGFPISLVMVNNSNLLFVTHVLHEFEHAFASFLITFQLPKKMEIDTEKGSKVFVPPSGGCLVTLAPYYFALLTIPFLVFKAALYFVFSLMQMPFPALLAVGLDLLIGATLVFHYATSLKEFRFSQPDIKKTGYLSSIVGVLFVNFMMLVLSLTVVTGSYAGFLEYLKTAVVTTMEAYTTAYEWLTTKLVPFLDNLLQTILGKVCRDCTPTPTPEI